MWLLDVVDSLETKLPPELAILRDSSPLPVDGTPLRRSGLPFPFLTTGGMPPLGHLPYESNEPEIVLNVDLSVQCKKERMVVSIDKQSLQVSKQPDILWFCPEPNRLQIMVILNIDVFYASDQWKRHFVDLLLHLFSHDTESVWQNVTRRAENNKMELIQKD